MKWQIELTVIRKWMLRQEHNCFHPRIGLTNTKYYQSLDIHNNRNTIFQVD